MEAVFVFPHHLFENHPAFRKDRLICLLEDPLFFGDERYPLSFHKQKLVFHFASMRQFEKSLQARGYQTAYIEANRFSNPPKSDFIRSVVSLLKPCAIHVAEIDDYILEKRLRSAAEEKGLSLTVHTSPLFLAPLCDYSNWFRRKSHFFFHSFYIEQRKRFGILMEEGGPVGDKWSFDSENRKKVPKGLYFPPLTVRNKDKEVQEAKELVEKNYSHCPGSLASFNYPTSHEGARRWFEEFLQTRFQDFGLYEDALMKDERLLFHSLLSPLLNTGLLTPKEVVEKTLTYAATHKIPLNSMEGFLRQIIGWREFIRGVYHFSGTIQRKRNFFGHERKMPRAFYEGASGIFPLDHVIKTAQKHAYLHHIERLMVAGNFFFLCEIHPNEVYKWFMELFIDAYDWVMVPNVYGMSQYADGGMMTTKPYISGSNYLLKMSNYPKGEWTALWDALFWRKMIKHLPFFEKQPRLRMIAEMAKKKAQDVKTLSLAERFLEELD